MSSSESNSNSNSNPPPIKPYTDKLASTRILIIGGTSGIGLQVASLCLAHNAHVTIASSNQGKVTTAISRLRSAYPNAQLDGHTVETSAAACEASVAALFAKVGKVDHVVHTAGDRLAMIPLKDVTVSAIQKAGEVRFISALIVAKYAAQYLSRSTASSLTFTSGTVAERPHQNWSVVASYAAGLYGMTRNLAMDMAPIRVNLVSPGSVDTELWDALGMDPKAKEGLFANLGKKMPTGEVGRAEDVAEAYLYCMRDRNVTGVVLRSDGGGVIAS